MLFILVALLAFAMMISSCGDSRTPPAASSQLEHTQTIVLWNDQVSNGQAINADFTVERDLMEIMRVGQDKPARLYLWAYIRPDADILWRESIIRDTTPVFYNHGISLQIELEKYGRRLDSLTMIADSMTFAFDSTLCDTPFVVIGTDTTWCDSILFRLYPDSMVHAFDTTGVALPLQETHAIYTIYADSNAVLMRDSTLMGVRRDSLGYVLDDRFSLAMWLDDDSVATYPEAIFNDTLLVHPDTLLFGQSIYLAATDSASGLKCREFSLNLALFNSADSNNPLYPLENNWTCFPGVTRCLHPGVHSLRVRLNGTQTKITGTIVLVYETE